MKLPNPEKSEVIVIRTSLKVKNMLIELAKASQFGNNSSAVVRYLIANEHAKMK